LVERSYSLHLSAIADRLAARRDAILEAWRARSSGVPEPGRGSPLSRAQFFDHIPNVLDAFENELKGQSGAAHRQAVADVKRNGGAHGLLRWQQGYRLPEVMREWGNLQLCLVDAIEEDALALREENALAHRETPPQAMAEARRILAKVCADGICESAAQYAALEQLEAADRVRDLEQAIQKLNDLDLSRAETLREAAHDLRGNLGILKTATALLDRGPMPRPQEQKVLGWVATGVDSMHLMLEDLMSLARLEAGHEVRTVGSFDAGVLLAEVCANLHPAADAHRLFLKSAGPDSFIVEGDRTKVQRIAQNLILNALKYTERGGVTVIWEESRTPETDRWMLCVQDSGPGFAAGGITPLESKLKEATDQEQQLNANAGEAVTALEPGPAPTLASQSEHRRVPAHGEGIGLSIVKRLCELLDASIELETHPGTGSTFRITFPRRY